MKLYKNALSGAALMLLAACAETPHAAPPQAAVAGEKPISYGLAYPETMLRDKETADVNIGCTVDTTGVPQGCKMLYFTGNSEAAKSALAYVTKARYVPLTHNGVPTPAYHIWKIRFRVSN